MNIGLVLSGGMAKGAYQIGALRALQLFVPFQEIKYMSCASVGVLNGYAYATNNLGVAEEMWRSICCENARFFISQILRSSMLQQKIKSLYTSGKDLDTVFYCSLLDINHRNVIYKDLSAVADEDVPLYLKASVAMPIYNKSVQIDDIAYFDGAMIDNIPVYPLLKHNLDYIICVYFDNTCYQFENTYFDNKIVKITFPSESVLKKSIIFEQNGIKDMIDIGFERTKELFESIFANGHEDVEAIYQAIEHKNQSSKSRKLRITGDMLVTNLNRITQKLAKRKII